MCYFGTVQCGLKSIELKAKAGALVFNIEIKAGAKASHLGHGFASAGLSASRRWHCHGCFCR
jgi:peptide methionine sulfoxide reductase MsrB